MKTLLEKDYTIVDRLYRNHKVIEIIHNGAEQLPDEIIERWIKSSNRDFDIILITNFSDKSFDINLI